MLHPALQYAELGYPVLPIKPLTKLPLTKNGLLDATTEADKVERWLEQWPNANWAIATTGLVVVDLDVDDNGEPNAWLSSEPDKIADLAKAPLSLTPRGGRHFIFRQPASGGLRNTASKLAPHVDTRADGGYIVVPPSVLEGDRHYRWGEGMALEMSPSELPEPPAWLIASLQALGTAGSSVRAKESTPAGVIPEGGRNAYLTSYAGTMRRVGMSQAEIAAALHQVNRDRCQPSLTAEEVDTIAWSVARYEPTQVMHAVAALDEQLADDRPVDPGKFPEHLLKVPGFMGQVIAHNLDGAHKPQPVLALGAALALMSVLTGRKIADVYDTRTNLYAIGVCGTSAGKERGRTVNKEILHTAGLAQMIGPESIGSSAGLVSVVEAQPAILLQLDEIGRHLQTLGDARQSHLYNIVTVLMKLFTSSASIYIGDAYADTKRIKTIYQPHCVVYGTTTPDVLYDSLSSSSLTDGFLSRVLIFEGDEPEFRERMKPELPEEIVKLARVWGDYLPGGNLASQIPQPLCVDITPDARQIFVGLNLLAESERKRLGEPLGTLWPRSVEKAHKLALLWACSEDANVPAVDVEAAQWACEVVCYLTKRLAFLASRWLSENKLEADTKRISRIIESAGPAGLSKGELGQKTRWIRRKDREEIIATLLESSEIVAITITTTTKPKHVYVARQFAGEIPE